MNSAALVPVGQLAGFVSLAGMRAVARFGVGPDGELTFACRFIMSSTRAGSSRTSRG
jgi:hypothetical protein